MWWKCPHEIVCFWEVLNTLLIFINLYFWGVCWWCKLGRWCIGIHSYIVTRCIGVVYIIYTQLLLYLTRCIGMRSRDFFFFFKDHARVEGSGVYVLILLIVSVYIKCGFSPFLHSSCPLPPPSSHLCMTPLPSFHISSPGTPPNPRM